MRVSKRVGVVTAMSCAAALVGGGWAWAAQSIPSADGVIHSCYNVTTFPSLIPSGSLRVIDPASGGACSKREKALNFNQIGQQGPVGAQGPTGPQGPAGADGARGAEGTPGPAGTPGATGARGPAGQSGTSALYAAGGAGDGGGLGTASITLNVPAGTYAVNASAVVFNNDNDDPQSAICKLNDGNAFAGRADRLNETTVAVLDDFTFQGPSTLTLTCGGFKIVLLTSSVIQAIKIG